MNAQDKKKVVVELFVTPGQKDRPPIENLIRGQGLTVNLRRARVTARDAWLQLDVSGAPETVDAFIRRRKNKFAVISAAMDNVA